MGCHPFRHKLFRAVYARERKNVYQNPAGMAAVGMKNSGNFSVCML
jgi:hypothetical protein